MSQAPDTQPGAYYVTVHDGRRYGRLLGPFVNDHAQALSMVDAARAKAEELDPRAAFYSFGTARLDASETRPGVLNDYFSAAGGTN